MRVVCVTAEGNASTTTAPTTHEASATYATESNHTVAKAPEETHHELGTEHSGTTEPATVNTTEPVLEKVLEAVLKGQTATTTKTSSSAHHTAAPTDAPDSSAHHGGDSDRERERRRDSNRHNGDDVPRARESRRERSDDRHSNRRSRD